MWKLLKNLQMSLKSNVNRYRNEELKTERGTHNKGETAVHGCHYRGNMAVRMPSNKS